MILGQLRIWARQAKNAPLARDRSSMIQDRWWDADDDGEDEKMSAADREMTRPCLLETSPRPPYVLFHERLNWRW